MTWEEVEKLSATNVVVHAWMTLYQAGRITREQMLCGTITALAEYAEKISAALVKAKESMPFNIVFEGVKVEAANKQEDKPC